MKAETTVSTELAIVGAGAAGLMAGATAGEYGLRTIILERKHLPGRKLLMCGNNRCNVSHAASLERFLEALGAPVNEFAAPAVRAFAPDALRAWFADHRMPTVVKADDRVYPASEKADDVLHCFQDTLRAAAVPLMLNAAIGGIVRDGDAFRLNAERFTLTAHTVLLATGGVSYPKTGCVGDGQTFARALGHHVEPYRPGLAGYEIADSWVGACAEAELKRVRLTLRDAQGRALGAVAGDLLCTSWGLRGSAAIDASRLAARNGWAVTTFDVDTAPDAGSVDALGTALRNAAQRLTPAWRLVENLGIDPPAARALIELAGIPAATPSPSLTPDALYKLAATLKGLPLRVTRVRPLKEAMVTVGGVRLDEVDPLTMQSRRVPGLYFAGEVLDLDGPTGGYNLHLAFATARLAVTAIARRMGVQPRPSRDDVPRGTRPAARNRRPPGRRPPRRNR